MNPEPWKSMVGAEMRLRQAAISGKKIELRDGTGRLHCETGPAVIRPDGRMEFWVEGQRLLPDAELAARNPRFVRKTFLKGVALGLLLGAAMAHAAFIVGYMMEIKP